MIETIDIAAFFPEIILSALLMVVLFLGIFGEKENYRVVMRLGVLSLVAAGIVVYRQDVATVMAFSKYIKLLVIALAAVSLLMSTEYLELHKIDNPKYPSLIIFALIGMMISISATNLAWLFAGLEMQTASLYGIASIQHKRMHIKEAGSKYFLLGAVSAVLFAYAAYLIFKDTGSINSLAISAAPVYAVAILTAAIIFKVTVMPFKMLPSSPVVAFFSVAPKLTAIAAITSFIAKPFTLADSVSQEIIIVVSIAMMVFGSVASLRQKKLKNLFAHASMYHMGYALMCFAVSSMEGMKSFVVYITLYAVISMGGFSAVLLMKRKGKTAEEITTLEGLGREQPKLALSFMLLLLSASAMPMITSFMTKFHIFKDLLRRDLLDLTIVGLISSVVAAYCYLRIIRRLYHYKPAHPIDLPESDFLVFILNLSIVAVVVFMIFPDVLVGLAERLF